MALTTEYGDGITAFSVQQGGFITIRRGDQSIQIDPFTLRKLLYDHTDEEYFAMDDEDETAPGSETN